MARRTAVLEKVRLEREVLELAAEIEGKRARLYTPCPGNFMPAGPFRPPTAHPPIVFLERKVCKDQHRSIHMNCVLCGHRMFLMGEFWRAAFWSLDQVLAACPEAINGRGQRLAELVRR